MKGIFRSLNGFNYRMWAAGAIVSNVGTWMQRTAQDWIVLTELTHHNATAVGVVIALQFAPQVLLLSFTGFAADHLDRRKLLFATQTAMGALALGLGISSNPFSLLCAVLQKGCSPRRKVLYRCTAFHCFASEIRFGVELVVELKRTPDSDCLCQRFVL
jgi:MFS family permease